MNEWLNAIMRGKPSTSQCHMTTQKRIYYKIKYKIIHFYLFQKILLLFEYLDYKYIKKYICIGHIIDSMS